MSSLGRLRYVETAAQGTGRARGTLVLVHAFPLNGRMWEGQQSLASAGWRIIAPHFRGMDGGEQDPEAVSVDDYAGDIIDLLDGLHVHEAVIGGLSMGGYVTLAVHRLAPQRCRALILADTRAEADTDEAKANRVRLQATGRERGPDAVLQAMLPKLVGPGAQAVGTVPEQLKAIARTNTPEGIVDGLEALKTRPDAGPGLAAIACPTLVIVGGDDALTPPSAAETLRDGIAGAQLVVLPDAGHMSNLEQPVAFALALWSFLR